MASQLAQIISQYGQTMPTGGLERGVQGFYAMKEAGERKALEKEKLGMERELFDIKLSCINNAIFLPCRLL